MARKKMNRGALAGANRGSGIVCSATNTSEFTPTAPSMQLAFIARRVGMMDTATLAAIASIAFQTTGEPR